MMFYINNEYIEKAYALLKDQEISNDLSIDFGMTKHIKQLNLLSDYGANPNLKTEWRDG